MHLWVSSPALSVQQRLIFIMRRYVTVNEEAERALFYAFAESQSSPSKDPLMLWLNG